MSRLLLEGLLPDLKAKAILHESRCKHEGIDILFTAGFRSYSEQMSLYAQGRERGPNGWVVTGKIVTRALPEKSAHCRRAAYDIACLVGRKVVYDGHDGLYRTAGRLGKELGLVWGGDFTHIHDMPHFGLPDWQKYPLVDAHLSWEEYGPAKPQPS